MPFFEKSIMEQRTEFTALAAQPGSNMSDLCRRFAISRKTGYKWLNRYLDRGLTGLLDQSKRPSISPNKTQKEIEEYIIKLRKADPEWGSKKLHRIIQNHLEQGFYPFDTIPCITTITKILKRNGLINDDRSNKAKNHIRFEYNYPNELWQMDFKGYFLLSNKSKCHPLTITDDHSRYNICLSACRNQREVTVRHELIKVFTKYGLPYMMLTDNGSPWGSAGSEPVNGRAFTKLEKWLIKLNIKLIHGRPYHPQTQGKEERFHRTLKQELINYVQLKDFTHCQNQFDTWREKYNCIRPHEALSMDVPIKRYQPSDREYPNKIKPFEYNSTDTVKKVQDKGLVQINNNKYRVGKAFIGEYVALRHNNERTKFNVYFCNELIRSVPL